LHPVIVAPALAAESADKPWTTEDAVALIEPPRREDEMDASRREDEERALAFAALALVKGTINALEQKGLLKGSDIQGIFDGALTSLEHRVQDPAIGLARRIVEGIAIGRASQGPEGSG
jgi:hypothetical protein